MGKGKHFWNIALKIENSIFDLVFEYIDCFLGLEWVPTIWRKNIWLCKRYK